VMGEIFGPMREEITGGCGKLHNEGLQNYKYYQRDQVKANGMAEHVARMGEKCTQNFCRKSWWEESSLDT
jgi:hypothetical protein